MLPKLSKTIELEDLTFWQTNDGKIGTGFEINHCDLEMDNPEDFTKRLAALVKNIHPNVLGKIHFKCFNSNDFKYNTSRMDDVSKLGFRKNRILFFINHLGNQLDLKNLKNFFARKSDFSQELEILLELRRTIENSGFGIRPLSSESITQLFDINYDLIKTTKSVESSTESIGVIRLIKQSSEEVTFSSLSSALEKIDNFEISVSFRRLPESHAKLILEKRLKQLKSQTDVTSKVQSDETEESLKNQFSKGTQLVEFEFFVVLKRSSQSQLLKDMAQATTELNKFSEFKIETFGVAESYVATHPASNQHVTLLESNETIPAFMPLFQKSDSKNNLQIRSLSLLRENNSLSHFDLFSSEFNCFNSLIVGTSGKGKSVLTGLLTRALLHDPNVQIIKVDVGGSHSKECELFGGTEFKMKLDEPSGINPFLVLHSKASDSEKTGILSKFLSVLILENGEHQFSKEIRSQIEEAIQNYILSSPPSPDLNHFYESAKDFPCRNLLKRWVQGGIYETSFKTTHKEKLCNTRLQYYNFSQVFQASDPEFAQAGIAAVLAQFNIDSITTNGKRLVLICDETPFFIKTCFDFFKFSTANVRKYGHAVVLISQLSTDFVVNNDYGIIENSPQRFLFSIDGKAKEYQERFNLTENHIETIQDLRSIPKEFSEVFLQTGVTGKKLRIKITPEEYWALTTSQPDQLKIQKLRQAIPELSLEEALRCLSIA
jgi:type IV secretory pathway VirB4 component